MKRAALNLALTVKKTYKREFLEQVEQVVPWVTLIDLIAPLYPKGRTTRPPFSLQTMGAHALLAAVVYAIWPRDARGIL